MTLVFFPSSPSLAVSSSIHQKCMCMYSGPEYFFFSVIYSCLDKTSTVLHSIIPAQIALYSSSICSKGSLHFSASSFQLLLCTFDHYSWYCIRASIFFCSLTNTGLLNHTLMMTWTMNMSSS